MSRLQMAGLIIFSVGGGAAAAIGEVYTGISGRVSGPVLAVIILAPNLYVIWLKQRCQGRRTTMPAARAAMRGLTALAVTGALGNPVRADEPDNSDAYQKAVGSVVYIQAVDRHWNIYGGTGVVINAERGEILTAFHVVGNDRVVTAELPCRDKNGEIITDVQHYAGMNIESACVTVVTYEGHDLALIRWKTPPKDLKAIRLSAKSASPGASVFCIGNGASMLFRYSGGSVRQLADESYTTTSKQEIKARILTTRLPDRPRRFGRAGHLPRWRAAGHRIQHANGAQPDS